MGDVIWITGPATLAGCRAGQGGSTLAGLYVAESAGRWRALVATLEYCSDFAAVAGGRHRIFERINIAHGIVGVLIDLYQSLIPGIRVAFQGLVHILKGHGNDGKQAIPVW